MTVDTTLITNENTELEPITSFDGPVLEFDFPSLHIGVAEYNEGPTGCTVFYFPQQAASVIDIRGGSPGTIQGTSNEDSRYTRGICFAGGSLWGLEAIVGASVEISAQTEWDGHQVRGAILNDLGSRRPDKQRNKIYPDKELGRAAVRAARPGVFPLGARGAGRSVMVGSWLSEDGDYQPEFAGQGGAFYQTGPTKVAVFTVVNAVGVIVDRQGNVIRGHYNPQTNKRYKVEDVMKLPGYSSVDPPSGNTTLTLVITNQIIDMPVLRQFAKQVHSSMSRAIAPFHTPSDGDVLFAVSTNEVENSKINPYGLAHIASELAWDAVLSCVQQR